MDLAESAVNRKVFFKRLDKEIFKRFSLQALQVTGNSKTQFGNPVAHSANTSFCGFFTSCKFRQWDDVKERRN
jgi:hypothetical protein